MDFWIVFTCFRGYELNYGTRLQKFWSIGILFCKKFSAFTPKKLFLKRKEGVKVPTSDSFIYIPSQFRGLS